MELMELTHYTKNEVFCERFLECPAYLVTFTEEILNRKLHFLCSDIFCTICKNANDHGILNNVKVEDSFLKSGYSNCKNARSADKEFQKDECSKCHQKVIQRLVEI